MLEATEESRVPVRCLLVLFLGCSAGHAGAGFALLRTSQERVHPLGLVATQSQGLLLTSRLCGHADKEKGSNGL